MPGSSDLFINQYWAERTLSVAPSEPFATRNPVGEG